jgi:hypothetical protein
MPGGAFGELSGVGSRSPRERAPLTVLARPLAVKLRAHAVLEESGSRGRLQGWDACAGAATLDVPRHSSRAALTRRRDRGDTAH